MHVKLLESICGHEAGAIVSVSNDRGLLWIQRGYAVNAGESPIQESAATRPPENAAIPAATVREPLPTPVKTRERRQR